MIVTSEAIVLRARKQGETSKIVTLYTHDFGKLNVIAKGAREMKSKFGGALEMFARTSAVFYKKEKSEPGLYLLSKADIVDSHVGILQSLDRIGPAMAVSELILRAMHDEEANPLLFHLVADTLRALSSAERDALCPILEFRFYTQFIRLMGFGLDHISRGGLPRESVEAILALEEASVSEACEVFVAERTQQHLRGFFQVYFVEHLPGMTGRSMRSGKIFDAL